jgi:hypothetical protein
MVGAVGATAAIVVPQLAIAPAWFVMLPTVLLAVVLLLFGSLRLTITDQKIEAAFGVGLLRKRIPLADVRSVTRVRNPWYCGWGIRSMPNGMLYNVSGFDAVELSLADGRHVRLGTDEPDAVIAVLSQRHGIGVTTAAVEPVRGRPLTTVLLIVALIVVPAVIVGTVVVASMRPVKTSLADGVLSINGGSAHETVRLPDIVSISLEPELPLIARRTNGFSMGSTRRGSFRLQDGEQARLFVEGDHPPFVFIRTKDSRIWINVSDADATRALYAALSSARGRP